MLNMRAMLVQIDGLLFPKDEMTGVLVRMKTGLHLEEHLNRRLGIMGPDFFKMVSTDFELEQEAEIIDRLPPERLAQLATELAGSRYCRPADDWCLTLSVRPNDLTSHRLDRTWTRSPTCGSPAARLSLLRATDDRTGQPTLFSGPINLAGTDNGEICESWGSQSLTQPRSNSARGNTTPHLGAGVGFPDRPRTAYRYLGQILDSSPALNC
jgi:hypothetical protein